MKKLLSIIISIMLSLGLNAQTELTQAPDFTTTDYFGNEINLYEILEGGQHVLINFYTTTKDTTSTIPPSLVEAYKRFGCNQNDVFFISILPNATPQSANKYIERYGIEFPIIHNPEVFDEGAAFDITRTLYKIYEFPTTILIAPDKSIVLQDIASIKESEDIVSALTTFGIKEYECGEEEGETTPVVEITVTNVTTTTVDVSFVPSGECASYYILLDTEESMEGWATAFGVPLEQLIEQWSIERQGPSTYLWDELVPNTEYTIFVLSKDIEGEIIQLDRQKVTTEVLGGEGVSIIDLQVEVISDSSVYVVATPNAETAEYHYILIEKLYADSIGVDSTMKILYADRYPLYDIDRWEWTPLSPNTAFYAIAQGKNAKGEWGEITKVEFVTTVEETPDGNIELAAPNFTIYPNPASTEVKITSVMNGKAEINIYDMTGRCVKNIRVSNISDVTINVSDINKGVYFINVNDKVEKLVIK